MSGKEGLAYLRTCDAWPDLVLLDCMMPGVSGFDVIGEMRRTFPNVHLPIIMISARIEEEHIIKVRQGRVKRAGSVVGQHALAQQPCRHCPSVRLARFYRPLPDLNAPALPRRAWTWVRTTTSASPSAAMSSSRASRASLHGPRRASAARRRCNVLVSMHRMPRYCALTTTRCSRRSWRASSSRRASSACRPWCARLSAAAALRCCSCCACACRCFNAVAAATVNAQPR